MRVRFLLDENLSPLFKLGIERHSREIDVLRVGDDHAPPLGTLDPDILRYLEISQRVLITNNRVSMPDHAAEHYASGGHHWGIFFLRRHTRRSDIVEAAVLLWEASEAEEWIDRLEWIPFR